ncbi:tat protein [Simian immunodeficiency virus]|uniref:Protein Tat n=1 Tax=Simian immunodeficiency virus TaxID=11723 RepID=E1ANV1_SIV|nr:tat protein [Simian immunodeficiency virus]
MDGQEAGLERQEEETLYNPFQSVETPCNACYCKKCAYHCQLCFLQKAIGIQYASRRRRRQRDKKEAKIDTLATPDKSLSATSRRRNSKPKEKKESSVEKAVATNHTTGRKDLSIS